MKAKIVGALFALSLFIVGTAGAQPYTKAQAADRLVQTHMPDSLASEVASLIAGRVALDNNTYLSARNAAGTSTIGVLKVDGSNNTLLTGYDAVTITGGAVGASSDINFKMGHASGTWQFQNTAGSNLVSIGGATGNIATEGTFTSARGADLGWSIVDQTDNQACTTGCTSACAAGQDLAGANKPLVGCSDTTADICLCAGAS